MEDIKLNELIQEEREARLCDAKIKLGQYIALQNALFEEIFEKTELFCGFGVFISEETERRTKNEENIFFDIACFVPFCDLVRGKIFLRRSAP